MLLSALRAPHQECAGHTRDMEPHGPRQIARAQRHLRPQPPALIVPLKARHRAIRDDEAEDHAEAVRALSALRAEPWRVAGAAPGEKRGVHGEVVGVLADGADGGGPGAEEEDVVPAPDERGALDDVREGPERVGLVREGAQSGNDVGMHKMFIHASGVERWESVGGRGSDSWLGEYVRASACPPR